MRKPKQPTEQQSQINQYDKILQENIEAALPGLIENILHIHAVLSEELPDNIQHTKERRPDLLKKITDDKGHTFVLHIEFQTSNDAEMPYRMLEYMAMLLRKYKMPVKQYVIYIGEDRVTMPTSLTNGKSIFSYELITIAAIDYHVFLKSAKPEEKMFAILADFGKDSPETAIANIAIDIANSAKSGLERERLKNQLRILAQLRTLVSANLKFMESVASFFKEENDIFFQRGEKRGLEKGSAAFVKNLLLAERFTISEIANFANVSEEFVQKIKEGL